jgi:hypothetical protein
MKSKSGKSQRARNGNGRSRFLKRVVSRLQRTNQAIEALIALALRVSSQPISESEMEYFCKKYSADGSALSKADAAALKKARPALVQKIKDIMAGKPANGELSRDGDEPKT